MTLQSAIDGELPFLRAEAESLMTDTCRITKPGPPGAINPETLQYDDPAPVVVYEGRCRIPSRGSATTGTTSNEDTSWEVGEYPLNLPVLGAEEVAVGMTVNYLTSKTDPALVGCVFGITDLPRQTHATARRFRMKQIVGN